MQRTYFILMFVAAILSIIRGEERLLLCAGVVAYNWVFNTAFVLISGNTDAVYFFLASDVVALVLVLRWADSLILKQLASLYVGQIILHLTKMVGGGDPYYYWQVLTALGYFQLLALILAALYKAPMYRDADREPC